jgi:hypothetical protein
VGLRFAGELLAELLSAPWKLRTSEAELGASLADAGELRPSESSMLVAVAELGASLADAGDSLPMAGASLAEAGGQASMLLL